MEFKEIMLKACARDPAQRYKTADELREDLELLTTGRSINLETAVKPQRHRDHGEGRNRGEPFLEEKKAFTLEVNRSTVLLPSFLVASLCSPCLRGSSQLRLLGPTKA